MPTTFWSCLSPQIGVTPPRWRNSSALAYNSQPWLQRRSSLLQLNAQTHRVPSRWQSEQLQCSLNIQSHDSVHMGTRKFSSRAQISSAMMRMRFPGSWIGTMLPCLSPHLNCPLQFRIEEHKLELGSYDRTNQQLGFSFFASRRKVVHWFQQNRH